MFHLAFLEQEAVQLVASFFKSASKTEDFQQKFIASENNEFGQRRLCRGRVDPSPFQKAGYLSLPAL